MVEGSLPTSVQAFLQQLLARAVVTDDVAQALLKECQKGYGDGGHCLEMTLELINKHMEFVLMEVRSINVDGVQYHGLVNKASDDIAKKFGCDWSDWKIKVFKDMLAKFGEKHNESSEDSPLASPSSDNPTLTRDDLEDLKPRASVTLGDLYGFLKELEEEQWVKMEANNRRFGLGIRAQLELHQTLRSHGLPVKQIMYH
ncbi:unnamed protein product [Chrysoparadoxa australica]